jgi:hypothetical protein
MAYYHSLSFFGLSIQVNPDQNRGAAGAKCSYRRDSSADWPFCSLFAVSKWQYQQFGT